MPDPGLTEKTEQRSWAEELRGAVRMVSPAEVPPATESDGPDPYGNPDPEWLRIDWRAHLRRTDVVGTEVNYVEYGQGPPVLLVHGLGGSWQNWLEQIPHLGRSHRVIAVDLPGFGNSPEPQWEISMPAYGRFLRDFCERLGLETCPLIGSSMGGFIGTELAINEPDRVERLVLVSAAGVTWSRMRSEPVAVAARVTRAAAPLAFRYRMEGLRRSRLRQLAYRGLVHDPRGLRPELLFEMSRRACARAASTTRWSHSSATTSATGLPRSRCRLWWSGAVTTAWSPPPPDPRTRS